MSSTRLIDPDSVAGSIQGPNRTGSVSPGIASMVRPRARPAGTARSAKL